MSGNWIVVIDNAKTRVFSVEREAGELQPVVTLQHPEGHVKSREIESDRPGRAFDTVGQGRHGVGTPVDPVEQVRIRYVRRIADYLRQAALEGRCNRLLLVADAHLTGLLRKVLELPPGVALNELEKNLGPFDDHQLREHLQGHY